MASQKFCPLFLEFLCNQNRNPKTGTWDHISLESRMWILIDRQWRGNPNNRYVIHKMNSRNATWYMITYLRSNTGIFFELKMNMTEICNLGLRCQNRIKTTSFKLNNSQLFLVFVFLVLHNNTEPKCSNVHILINFSQNYARIYSLYYCHCMEGGATSRSKQM